VSQTSPEAIQQQIIARAARDPQFRSDLMRDPKGTLAREMGVAVPADFDLQVVEETPKRRYLVLPPAPQGALTDEQLAAVAGGADYSYTCTGGCN
jgi:hypothetical protein